MKSKDTLRNILIPLIIGVVLLGIILQAQYLISPESLDDISRVLFRIVVWLTLPVRLFLVVLIPPHAHHYSLTHWIALALLTPLLYTWIWIWVWSIIARMQQSGQCLHRRPKSLMIAMMAVVLMVGIYGVIIEPEIIRIREYIIDVKDLPEEFEGLTIVHVSDTHYGPYVSRRFLKRMSRKANALNPDVVILTGDYVHRTPLSIESGIGILGTLESRYGSVAVLGNHEHWEGVDRCIEAFRHINIPLVDNTRLFLTPAGFSDIEQPGQSICFAGVGDLWEDEVLFNEALEGVSGTTPRIVLSHNPDTAEEAPADLRIDLMCSGHTHGGQVRFPITKISFSPTRFRLKYSGGLYTGGDFPVVISRGIGLAGLPVRFLVPPELCLITLRRKI